MGGGSTTTEKAILCHKNASDKQMVGKGLKKRARSRPNSNENDDSPGNKKPKKVIIPITSSSHLSNALIIPFNFYPHNFPNPHLHSSSMIFVLYLNHNQYSPFHFPHPKINV